MNWWVTCHLWINKKVSDSVPVNMQYNYESLSLSKTSLTLIPESGSRPPGVPSTCSVLGDQLRLPLVSNPHLLQEGPCYQPPLGHPEALSGQRGKLAMHAHPRARVVSRLCTQVIAVGIYKITCFGGFFTFMAVKGLNPFRAVPVKIIWESWITPLFRPPTPPVGKKV